jgi:uncharacterized membrane protein YkvI
VFAGCSRVQPTSFTAPTRRFVYLLTGALTMLAGMAMLQSSAFEESLAWPGIIIGLFLVVASLEFVGRFEERSWKLAGAIVPITYIACLRGSSAASKVPGLKQ